MWAAGESSANGVAVPFDANDLVRSAGGYSALTGSAIREVPDLIVPGAVGKYPLAFVRNSTSRYVAGGEDDTATTSASLNSGPFGPAGSWRHNYRWGFFKAASSPSVWRVNYPEGKVVFFTRMTNLADPATGTVLPSASQDPYLRSQTPGVSDRLEPLSGSADYILHRHDGGTVYFQQQGTVYKAIYIRDPFNQQTNLDYYVSGDAAATPNWDNSYVGKLKKITEPAGRYLSIKYSMQYGQPVVDTVTASNGQYVTYNYGLFSTSSGLSLTSLKKVLYNSEPDPTPGMGGTCCVASYTYANDNTGAGLRPLLATCDDSHFPGALPRIKYQHDTSSSVYGQIKSESDDLGNVISTFNQSNRTNTRGDGPGQSFTYPTGGYLLSSATDFESPANPTGFGYDANSFQKSVTDPDNKTTTYLRDPYVGKRMTAKVTDPSTGQPLQATYDYGSTSSVPYPVNPYWLMAVTNPRQLKTTFTRDVDHQVKRVDYTDLSNNTLEYETFSYNSFGQVTYHRETNGCEHYYNYYSNGNLYTYTDSANYPSHVVTLYYDAFDRVTRVNDFNNHDTWFAYNERHALKQVKHHDATHVDYTYDVYGNRLTVSDELGHTTATTYDNHRRPKTVTVPVNSGGITNAVTTYSYEHGTASGDTHTQRSVGTITLPSGKKIKRTYSGNGRLKSETKGYGSATDQTTDTYGYDPAGNLLWVKDNNGTAQVTNAYDALERRSTATDANGHVTTYTYYPATSQYAGLPWKVKAPGSSVGTIAATVYQSYDNFDRLLTTQDASIHTTGKTYDSLGRLASVSDMNGSYTYGYDLMGRTASLQFPDATTQTWAYDAVGNLTTYKNRAGSHKTFKYDSRNRPARADWDDSLTSPTIWTFDDANHLTALDNSYALIRPSYDDAGQVTSETEYAGSYSQTTSYTHDVDGNITTIGYPAGDQAPFTYDDQNRCVGLGTPSFWWSHLLYKGELVTARVLNNKAVTTEYGYQPNLRVNGVWHHHGDTDPTFAAWPGNNISARNYGYAPDGQLTWGSRLSDGGTRTSAIEHNSGENYKYDPAGSLAGFGLLYSSTQQSANSQGDSDANAANFSGTSSYGGYWSSYAYDGSGNRTSATQLGSTSALPYTADSENRYNGSLYDNNGNTTNSAVGWNYSYDAEGHLMHATNPTTGEYMDCWHDGAGRMVFRGINGSATILCYAGAQRIEEREFFNNTSLYRYFHDAPGSDAIVFRQKSNGVTYGGARLFYQYDVAGNTTHVTDDSGTVLEQYLYDAYGTPYVDSKSGNYLGQASTQDNRYLFHGASAYEWLYSPRLYYCRARMYLPTHGRFLQPDPSGFAGGDVNLYRYCFNDPISKADPSGLNWWNTFINHLLDAGSSGITNVASTGYTPTGSHIPAAKYLDNGVQTVSFPAGSYSHLGGAYSTGSSGEDETSGTSNLSTTNVGTNSTPTSGEPSTLVPDYNTNNFPTNPFIVEAIDLVNFALGVVGNVIGLTQGIAEMTLGILSLNPATVVGGAGVFTEALIPRYGLYDGPGWGIPETYLGFNPMNNPNDVAGYYHDIFWTQARVAAQQGDFASASSLRLQGNNAINNIAHSGPVGIFGSLYRAGIGVLFQTGTDNILGGALGGE